MRAQQGYGPTGTRHTPRQYQCYELSGIVLRKGRQYTWLYYYNRDATKMTLLRSAMLLAAISTRGHVTYSNTCGRTA
eukprot:252638-Rhodomonas_salina.1